MGYHKWSRPWLVMLRILCLERIQPQRQAAQFLESVESGSRKELLKLLLAKKLEQKMFQELVERDMSSLNNVKSMTH